MSGTALDSKPVFEARLRSIDVPNHIFEKLRDEGIDTLAKLAFLTGAQPGASDDDKFVDSISKVLGFDANNPIPMGLLAGLRRAWFEAHTVAVAEVRQKLERPEDAPKKLPLPEREVRRQSQQLRLVGVPVEGSTEPSHALVDMVFAMRDDDVVRYIEPMYCTTRTQELKGIKKEVSLRIDQMTGNVKQQVKETLIATDISNEFKLRTALQRRSLALDQLDLVPYEQSEKMHSYLFELTQKDVPSSHNPITMEQVMIADRQIWLYMAEHCRTGLTKDAMGVYPMAEAMKQALQDPIVLSLLQPLPRASSYAKAEKSMSNPGHRSEPYESKGKSKSRAKGKSKGKGKSRQSVPSVLRGGSATNREGYPICFNHNISGCSEAKNGERCNRGLHVCCKCFSEEHTFQTCSKKR
jgi:hypothetical protein